MNFQFINNGRPITINGAGLFAKHVSHFYACPNPGPRGKTALKVKCFKEAFNWLKMNLVSWCKNQGEVPGRGFPQAFGSVSVEAIQETSEIFILTKIDGQISRLSAMADL